MMKNVGTSGLPISLRMKEILSPILAKRAKNLLKNAKKNVIQLLVVIQLAFVLEIGVIFMIE